MALSSHKRACELTMWMFLPGYLC